MVGLPLNMDGTEQLVTTQAKNLLIAYMDAFGVQIALHDERLSTVEARAHLFEQGGIAL